MQIPWLFPIFIFSLTFNKIPWLLPSLEFPWLFPDRWTPWDSCLCPNELTNFIPNWNAFIQRNLFTIVWPFCLWANEFTHFDTRGTTFSWLIHIDILFYRHFSWALQRFTTQTHKMTTKRIMACIKWHVKCHIYKHMQYINGINISNYHIK